MTSKCPEQIIELIERFREHLPSYKSGSYNETQVRVEFINPLFEALGWDVHNKLGYAEAYKDVVHEDAIKIGGWTKAPDYCFRIGGQRKFFLEAKKPAVNVRDDDNPAYQLRRYAWSAKLPLSILTDFEELAVYDCRVKPLKNDRPAKARVLYLTFNDYVTRWEELSSIFSPESIRKGSFDKFADSNKQKRGTEEVDASFLAEIETWREVLARNIALRNADLNARQLNYCVQQTIDRIIFLRICEDRGIEQYGRLMALQNGDAVYPRLLELFRKADDKYNSGLFYFRSERGRGEHPDTLTPRLAIDDKILKEIFKKLYYPECPFEFSVFTADILGQVYEQFLGKVIHLSKSGKASIEEKPEVKKAGGVFYTPTFVVDYIVKNTVGKLCEGKTARQVAKLKIVDPACGSGSFLIGAYQFLLDWHRDFYLAEGPEKHKKVLFRASGNDWRLTIQERKRILLNNIFGVDIDSQAVEVTKLSLLLKSLEGESDESVSAQMRLFQERALPDLAQNIKCGNSVIGPEFYRGSGQLTLLTEEENFRVNVFEWKKEFAHVFEEGGFDAVVGNPPYVRIQTMREWAPIEADFFGTNYKSASEGNYDLYVLFVEKGLSLLKSNGLLGFILSHKFFNASYGRPLRELLSQAKALKQVVHFGHEQIFEGASTYTAILILGAKPSKDVEVVRVSNAGDWARTGAAERGTISCAEINATNWNFAVGTQGKLLERLCECPVKLTDVTTRIFQGIKTSADKVYIVKALARSANHIRIFSSHTQSEWDVEAELWHPLIKGGDSKPFKMSGSDLVILFPYVKGKTGRADLITAETLSSRYPNTYKYLLSCKEYLDQREKGKFKGAKWYQYGRTQALDVMPLPKIFTPDIAQSPSFSFDSTGDVFFTGGVSGGYGLLTKEGIDPLVLLAFLNSSVTNWFIHQTSTPMRGGYFSFESRFISSLPLPQSIKDKGSASISRIKQLVEMLIDLKGQIARSSNSDAVALQRRIHITTEQLDGLVMELYGLDSAEQKAITANNTSGSSAIAAPTSLIEMN